MPWVPLFLLPLKVCAEVLVPMFKMPVDILPYTMLPSMDTSISESQEPTWQGRLEENKANVVDLIRKLGVVCGPEDIVNIHQLGKYSREGKPRPTKVTFERGETCREILLRKKSLKDLQECKEVFIRRYRTQEEMGKIKNLLQEARRDVVSLLLAHEASTNVQDFEGSTPLHLAAWAGHTEVVRTLLQQGPSIPNVNHQEKYRIRSRCAKALPTVSQKA
ncbi:Ankyrin repeat and sterile alpha motif domain-containing protein 1B [Halocaridina rubra]|uniref:Ankyrin repeat and sterile alpha motif domain-containing protein 1B n=1 Tax=Halocaridina rubra TaxID=373956 RepID=A0AAN8WFP4_HALRR